MPKKLTPLQEKAVSLNLNLKKEIDQDVTQAMLLREGGLNHSLKVYSKLFKVPAKLWSARIDKKLLCLRLHAIRDKTDKELSEEIYREEAKNVNSGNVVE